MSFLSRYRWVLLGVVAVGLIAGFFLTRGGDDGTVEIRGHLGPTPGPDASGYIREKTAFLERAAVANPQRDAAAVVSLAKRLRATDVTSLAGDGRVDLVFVSFPGEDPDALVVTGTVDVTVGASAEEVAADRDAEITALEEQARTLSGAERQRRLRAAAEKQTEATQLRGQCFCVYAFVVRDVTLADLAAMQERGDVRLVDVPDPVVADLRGWELTPLLARE